ncbi:hypothetical protein BDV12DRAFT_171602 [Aspergillus spectabilis]
MAIQSCQRKAKVLELDNRQSLGIKCLSRYAAQHVYFRQKASSKGDFRYGEGYWAETLNAATAVGISVLSRGCAISPGGSIRPIFLHPSFLLQLSSRSPGSCPSNLSLDASDNQLLPPLYQCPNVFNCGMSFEGRTELNDHLQPEIFANKSLKPPSHKAILVPAMAHVVFPVIGWLPCL